MHMLFLLFLALIVVSLLPRWPYSRGWGYFPAGTLGAAWLMIVFVAML